MFGDRCGGYFLSGVATKYPQPRVERSGTPGMDYDFEFHSPERAMFTAGILQRPCRAWEPKTKRQPRVPLASSLHPGLRVRRRSATIFLSRRAAAYL